MVSVLHFLQLEWTKIMDYNCTGEVCLHSTTQTLIPKQTGILIKLEGRATSTKGQHTLNIVKFYLHIYLKFVQFHCFMANHNSCNSQETVKQNSKASPAFQENVSLYFPKMLQNADKS